MIKGKDIVCISTSDWDKPWGSRQQLMSRLSAYNRVLFVEYQASFAHLFFLSFLRARIKRFKNPMRKINDNLFIYTPCPGLPCGYYSRTINRINQYMLLWFLKRILKKLDFADIILWLYPPSSVELLGKLGEKTILYHCIADFPAEKRISLRGKTVLSMEKELAVKSDVILTSTESLYNKYKHINSRTYLFPSAVDEAVFSSILGNDTAEPLDIAVLKRPRIGIVGYLDGNVLDIDLVSYIADRHPEWSIVLIGPKYRHTRRLSLLSKKDNIYFIPEKKNNEIPIYIKNLDVCIIPYVVNEFTHNVSPLKLYEYLAMGKPVVATALPDAERFKDVIRISYSKEDFIKNIELSLAEKNGQLIDRRLTFARENTWERRLKSVSQIICVKQKNERY